MENGEVESMVFGFKNQELMQITEDLRKVVVKLEYLLGLGLDVGEVVEIGKKNDSTIHMRIEKYAH